MQHPNIRISSLLLPGLLVCGLSGADVVGQDRSELEHLVFQKNQPLDSQAIVGAKYSIYLPKSYTAKENTQKRYPVIYFLHGMFEDHNRFGVRGGAKALDEAIDNKTVPDVIFVCAFDGSRRSFYVGKVETMIVRDLVPLIDKKYRTLADRDHRALMGVSMGGFGAMKIAFRNPTVFGILATHSAAILPEDSKDLDKMFPWARRYKLAAPVFGDPIDQKLWKAENPLLIARSIRTEQLAGMKIYFDCGDQDRHDLDVTNQLMHELLTKRKVPHSWSLVKGGNHGWNTRTSEVGYNNANLPNSLGFVGTALRGESSTGHEAAASKNPPREGAAQEKRKK